MVKVPVGTNLPFSYNVRIYLLWAEESHRIRILGNDHLDVRIGQDVQDPAFGIGVDLLLL